MDNYKKLFETNGVHVAGIEFIIDIYGMPYTYDINVNTNYNTIAEKEFLYSKAEFGGYKLYNFLTSHWINLEYFWVFLWMNEDNFDMVQEIQIHFPIWIKYFRHRV